MSDATRHTASPASTTSLEPELPFGLATEDFNEHEGISPLEAQQTLKEVWRMTQNPRMLEIEQQVRGHMVPLLQLSILASEARDNDGALDVTALAQLFIDTVRTEYADKLASGPQPEVMNPELANQLK